MAELLASPLGAIWTRPVDYRDAVRNTPFDLSITGRDSLYRRHSDRESTVERVIHKYAVLS